MLTPATRVAYADEAGTQKTATVQTVEADPGREIDFKDLFPEGQRVAYAFCYLNSDAEQTAHFELGSNDCAKVWINGVLAHSYWNEEGADSRPGAYAFNAELKKGLNAILVKVEDAGGRKWEFVLEAYDAKGYPFQAHTQVP